MSLEWEVAMTWTEDLEKVPVSSSPPTRTWKVAGTPWMLRVVWKDGPDAHLVLFLPPASVFVRYCIRLAQLLFLNSDYHLLGRFELCI